MDYYHLLAKVLLCSAAVNYEKGINWIIRLPSAGKVKAYLLLSSLTKSFTKNVLYVDVMYCNVLYRVLQFSFINITTYFFPLSWKLLYVVVLCVILPGEWFTGGRLQNRVIIILTFICSWVLHKRLHLDNTFSLSATSTVKLNFPSGQYFLCPKRSIASKHRELSRI